MKGVETSTRNVDVEIRGSEMFKAVRNQALKNVDLQVGSVLRSDNMVYVDVEIRSGRPHWKLVNDSPSRKQIEVLQAIEALTEHCRLFIDESWKL